MFLSKIKWYSLVGFESSNENPKFRCLGEQILFFFQRLLTLNGHQMVPEKFLFAEFETKFFFISVRNSTTGDGMALDKQI